VVGKLEFYRRISVATELEFPWLRVFVCTWVLLRTWRLLCKNGFFYLSLYSSIQSYAETVKKFQLFDLIYIGRLNFASPFVRAFFHRRSTESSPQHTLKPLSAH
jgi:hypothetical protein